MSLCPALTVHGPSAGVHVFLIYCVESQCCIICVLRKDINPSLHCRKGYFSPSLGLNVHCLKNDTSLRYFWAKDELYNFPISSEGLSVEGGMIWLWMASLIVLALPRTKGRGVRCELGKCKRQLESAISAASIRVMHCATLLESARVTIAPRRMEHSPTNPVRAEITGKKK